MPATYPRRARIGSPPCVPSGSTRVGHAHQVVDQVAEQGDDGDGLRPRGRPQVDPIEVEGPELVEGVGEIGR